MSRYSKSYGRGKSHGGAGLKFDTLLKACSNSKKPSANKTAGALGRFGIASFTSTRNVTGEEESRFKFFNKRQKLSEPAVTPLPSNTFHMNNNSQNVQQSPYGVVPPVVAPVFKPRKFFKSRDPAASAEDSSKESATNPPVRPEVIAPIKIPVPKARQREKYDSPEKNSSKPLRNANNASPPQPIKLRIFKDKATSKLVSVSEAPPPLEVVEHSGQKSNKGDKSPKKRGRKPKGVPDVLSPVKSQEPPPGKKSGRLTRNSRKHDDGNAQEVNHGLSDPSVAFSPLDHVGTSPTMSGNAENPYGSNSYNSGSVVDSRRTHCDPSNFPTNTNIEKKLEEDAEFQQLSQMLSSMEEDGGSDFNSTGYHQSSHNHQEPYAQLQQHIHSLPQIHQVHVQHQTLPQPDVSQFIEEPHQIHPSSKQYNDSQPFTQYHTDSMTSVSVPPSLHITANNSLGNTIINAPLVPPAAAPDPVAVPKVRDAQDIRAILEDDWDESFEDESPKKSPPKTSRFDLSAFMHEGSQSVPSSSPEQSYEAGPSPRGDHYSASIAEPVGVASAANSNFVQPYQQQQSQSNYSNPYIEQTHQAPLAAPFNAPYAVRNLLSSTKEFQSEPQIHSSFSQEAEVSSRFTTSSAATVIERGMKGNVETEKPIVALNLSVNPVQLPGAVAQANSQGQSLSTTKKGSIFKSRALAQSSGDVGEKGAQANPKKRLALYKHKFGQGDGDEESKSKQDALRPGAPSAVYQDEFDEDSDAEDVGSLRRAAVSEVGNEGHKVYCKKNAKNLYSVIRNVKPIHELQESGEFHEFDGDVWYILDELKDKNPTTNRCLSAITLATRCMEPAFRMHLRAHGTVAEFCKELHDAPTNPMLALLASTVLFVLSEDRLNMDLDTDSLKLIIALSKTGDTAHIADDSHENAKLRQRVIDLVSEMKNRGHAKHLKNEKITAAELALETLLYLTSKRAGDFLKHELRALGGLDYIVTEVVTSLDLLRYDVSHAGFSENVVDRLWKIDRCLLVLQQVTFNHEENQRYLLRVSDEKSNDLKLSGSPEIFISLFRFCNDHLKLLQRDSESAKVLHEILFNVLRVLGNLSQDHRGIVLGSEILCAMDGFLPLCLHSVFHVSVNIPDEKVFDLLMHSLCMLLNLVEYSKSNRNAILSSTVRRSGRASMDSSWSSDDSGVEEEQPTLDALVQMFVSKERAAKQEEASTDDILTKGSDSKKPAQKSASGSQASQNSQNSQESESSNSVQDTIDKLIHTAGKHMENTLIAAYISLLLAYLIMDDPAAAETVRNSMPNQRYLPLMVVLKKLFNFMSITTSASGSLRGLKATAIALKFYAKCDPQSNEELKKIIPD